MSMFTEQAETVRKGMAPWLKYDAPEHLKRSWDKKHHKAKPDKRSLDQGAWDSAILAAAEFVRRMTKDESLALQIHILLTKEALTLCYK